MNSNIVPSVHSKKEILTDPLGLFTILNKDNKSARTNDDKIKLQELWNTNLLLNQELKQLKFKSKNISREIGEAKRNNKNIVDLKGSMQSLSHQIKSCAQKINANEEKIIEYFPNPINKTSNTSHTHEPEFNFGKRNYIEKVDIDDITISLLNHNFKAWNMYVEQHSASCIHHRHEWQNLFKKSYGHQCFYFVALNSKKNIVGILPLTRLKSRLFGDLLVSMPYFQRGGPIADHPLIEQKLIQHANQKANNLNIDHIEYRDDIKRTHMPVQSHKVNMVLALPKTSDALWQSFKPKLRAQIKRPQREKTETLFGREELLNSFYSVYSRNMRDLGSPVHGKNFIANILKHFPNNSWLVVVKLNKKAVGASLLLGYKDTMEIPLASTIRDVNHLSINMLLYWNVLKFTIEKGYKYFDFGRSTKNTGTYQFKKQWGAQPQALYWHYWLSENSTLPSLNPDNPKFALLIYIWKRLPLSFANFIGPSIVKNIP